MKTEILRSGVVSDATENVFGYAAWPSVCQLPDGELLAAYSGNRLAHICPFGKVLLRRSADEGRTWSAPVIAVDTPLDDRDAGLTLLPDGRLLVTTFNNTRAMQRDWAERPVVSEKARALINAYCDLVTDAQEEKYFGSLAAFSEDEGRSFGELFRVPVSAPHGPSVHKGRLVYAGTLAPDRPRCPDFPIEVWESADGRDWSLLAKIPPCEAYRPHGHYEPHILSLGDRLLLTVREDGDGVFTVSSAYSDDDGKTWTPLLPTGAVGSPPHLLRLASGRIVMTYGRRWKPFGIEAIVSDDNGESWSAPVTLWTDAPTLDLGYPSSVELADGSIFTLYYGQPDAGAPCKILYTVWNLKND